MRNLQLAALPLPLDLPRTNLNQGSSPSAATGEDGFASLFRDAFSTVSQKPGGWGKDKLSGPHRSWVDRKVESPVTGHTRSGPPPVKTAQSADRSGNEAGPASGQKVAGTPEPAKQAGSGQACRPPEAETVAAGPTPVIGGGSGTEPKVDQGEEPPAFSVMFPGLPGLFAPGTLSVEPDTTAEVPQGNLRGNPGSEIELGFTGVTDVDLTGEQAKSTVVGEKALADVIPADPRRAVLPESAGDVPELTGKPGGEQKPVFVANNRYVSVDLPATGRNGPENSANLPDGTLEKPAQVALLAGLYADRKGDDSGISGRANDANKGVGSGQVLPEMGLNRAAFAQTGEVALTPTGETGGDLTGNSEQTPQDGGKETAGRPNGLAANGAGLPGLSEQRGQSFEATGKNGYLEHRQDIIRQIVAKAAVFKHSGMNGLTLQLKPEFLGQLHLQVITEDGLVSARFLAENPQVKQLIEGNLTQLKQSLEEQGLRFDRLEVGVGGHGSGFEPGGSQRGFWFGHSQNGLFGPVKWGNQAGVNDNEAALPDGNAVTMSYRSPDSTVEFLV